MKALSIRQPWAWLILRPDVTDPERRAEMARLGVLKNIENRDWPTHYRGRFLIHTGQTLRKSEFDNAKILNAWMAKHYGLIEIPEPEDLPRGGFLGTAELVACTDFHASPWFFGPYGFELANAQPFDAMIPGKGRLGFFSAPDSILVK